MAWFCVKCASFYFRVKFTKQLFNVVWGGRIWVWCLSQCAVSANALKWPKTKWPPSQQFSAKMCRPNLNLKQRKGPAVHLNEVNKSKCPGKCALCPSPCQDLHPVSALSASLTPPWNTPGRADLGSAFSRHISLDWYHVSSLRGVKTAKSTFE